MTPAQVRAAGGGATAFRINAGNPFADVSQTDYGVFIQDDWRIRPNITLSYGLRYETQTNAHSKYDFAPRLAVAWSPGAANSARPPKMVIRVGTGFFYNRFNESNTLQANRFNGVNVIQTSVTEPFDRSSRRASSNSSCRTSPRIYSLLNQWSPTAFRQSRASRYTADDLAGGSEPAGSDCVGCSARRWNDNCRATSRCSSGFYNIRIIHVIRARDVNAPLPFTITELTPNGFARIRRRVRSIVTKRAASSTSDNSSSASTAG